MSPVGTLPLINPLIIIPLLLIIIIIVVVIVSWHIGQCVQNNEENVTAKKLNNREVKKMCTTFNINLIHTGRQKQKNCTLKAF